MCGGDRSNVRESERGIEGVCVCERERERRRVCVR